MIYAIYTAITLYHVFAFVLGLAHAYDVDEKTRAAPVTWWWIIYAAALMFALNVLLVWGIFVGAIAENLLYGKKPKWESTPFEFNALAIIVAALAAGATYRLGWLCGLALQARLPPLAAVKIPVKVPLPVIRVIREHEDGKEEKRTKVEDLLDLLRLGVR